MIAKAKSVLRGLLLAMALLVFPVGYVFVQASDGGAAVKALIDDPMSIFAARSPGERGPQPFATSKPAYAMLDPPGKPDPVLPMPDSEAFLEPPAAAPGAPFDNTPALDDPFGLGPGGPFAPPAAPDGIGPAGFFPDPGVLPFDPDGPIGGPPPPLPTDPVGTPGGVPEPDTWLMMVIGFLATGAILRRQKQTIGNRA
ncbi:PEP-CTERM sorting domain-containing protein [Sandarakinorhabdus rubra]|uniref:PEP-CTERM sorting domain-containing protein n=1 Tax=Sandarakinorhabdus rubra TaxID=2672568 RepID=UPI0013DC57FD|nr:PEP-CTERM sorting domain-containing protein [Sandarakinorhabdus rubra]